MRTPRLSQRTALLLLIAALTGCASHQGTLQPVPPITDPVVFADDFGAHVDYQAFAGSKLDAIALDTSEKYSGTTSLRMTVPNVGDPTGSYSGGAFVTSRARELIGYNALTFWAKANRTVTLDIAGLGNDNTGNSRFTASRGAITLSTTWTRVVVPIPLAEKLTAERGLFFLAEGPEVGVGCDIWLDDIRFEQVTGITDPRPSFGSGSFSLDVGTPVSIQNSQVVFSVDGTDRIIAAAPGYFTFVSSNEAVATTVAGRLEVVGVGSCIITGLLGTVPAAGSIAITSTAAPTTAAPTPTIPSADVIALFSGAYTNRTVDTWSAGWDAAEVTDVTLQGNATKKYSQLVFAGVEFTSSQIDASTMTRFRADVWIGQGSFFRVKLVDFGPNAAFGGGDDSEHELAFSAGSTPALALGQWVTLDVPITAFANLTSRAHLAQMIFSGDTPTVYIDNILFYRTAP
jgi:hypothetical protein